MVVNPRCAVWEYFENIIEEGVAVCKICNQRLKNERSYTLRKHMQSLHNPNDEIWKYFTEKKCEAICKVCNKTFKNNNHTILRNHLSKKHDIIVPFKPAESFTKKKREYKAVKRKKSISELQLSLHSNDDEQEQMTIVTRATKRKVEETLIDNETKSPRNSLFIKTNKKQLMSGIIGLIVENNLKPELFYSKPLQALIEPICNAISAEDGLKFNVNEGEIDRVLNLIGTFIRTNFANDLHSRLLSLKIDNDLNAPPNTFCVSVQFIKDGERQTRILDLIDLKEETQLSQLHITQVLHKFAIDTHQIASAVFDNSKLKYNRSIKNSEYLNEIKELALQPDFHVGDTKVERYLGVTAQLCLLDIFMDSSIFKTFLECRNMVKFIGDISNGYCKLFEEKNLNLPQLDSPWRFGSTYKMLKDLHEARDILKIVKFEKPEDPQDQFNNNEELWRFIWAFCKSLTYLQKSILKYNSAELHIGDFYAQWLKCKLLTEKLQAVNKENEDVSKILSHLLQAIDKRTMTLLNQDYFAACIYLDPRFQRTLSSKQRSCAVEYLNSLWHRAELYMSDESEIMKEANRSFDNDEDAILNEFLSQDLKAKANRSKYVINKIENLKFVFKSVDTNVLSYWRSQKVIDPELHALSSICFGIPATQIFDKLLYSHACLLGDNSKLPEFTKENLLYIRLNVHQLNSALANVQLYQDDSPKISTPAEDVVEIDDMTDDERSSEHSTTSSDSEDS